MICALVLKVGVLYGWQMAQCVASYSPALREGCISHLRIRIVANEVLLAFIASKIKRINLINGCGIRVAKHLKGDWFKVLVLH